eukprot:6479263-Alexandrium_andersonii.AAC.1
MCLTVADRSATFGPPERPWSSSGSELARSVARSEPSERSRDANFEPPCGVPSSFWIAVVELLVVVL